MAARISHLVSQYNPVPTLLATITTSPVHHLQTKSSISSAVHSPSKRHQVIEIPLSANSPLAGESVPTTTFHNSPRPYMSPLLVVLDFDGTITQEDSLDTLTRLAAHYSAAKDPAVSETSLLQDWQVSVIEPYLQDLANFQNDYKPIKKDRSTWEEEAEYFESLRTVEEKSVNRVETSPIFKGFNDADYRIFGREAAAGNLGTAGETSDEGVEKSGGSMRAVKLRPGFSDFLSVASQSQWKLGLVSVNWSRHFIEGVLGVKDSEDVHGHHIRRNLDKEETRDFTGSPRENTLVIPRQEPGETGIELALLANHFTPKPRINGPAGWNRPLTTAGDKARAFDQLREGLKQHNGPVVYMGDSKTDLLCLRDADLSVVITDNPEQSSLVATLQRLGSQVRHVHDGSPPGTKYTWARDFTEILESKILSKLEGKAKK